MRLVDALLTFLAFQSSEEESFEEVEGELFGEGGGESSGEDGAEGEGEDATVLAAPALALSAAWRPKLPAWPSVAEK